MLKGMSVAATTLGCKVNQAETDSMLDMLKAAGANIVEFDEKADIYIVNTCSVTNIADKKSRQMLHRARKMNPDGIVIAAGCYVQSAREILEQDEAIDIVISNNKKKSITEIVNDYINVRNNGKNAPGKDHEAMEYFVDISRETEYEEMGGHVPVGHTRAYVKIQDGCNQFCSYCIIPYVRGRIRSRSQEAILAEVSELAEAGIKEVVLTGIHISSYGKDKNNEGALIELIEAISKIKGIKRIRLGSLEPGIITEEFVERISSNSKVCPHFHLSLQSGCDSVLKRMNRKYTCEQYFEKCDMLRKAYKSPALTTDVIVGFPGETEEDFLETMDVVKQVRYDSAFTFIYSKRTGTRAATMENQVPDDVVKDRFDRLLKEVQTISSEKAKCYEGKVVPVLAEEMDDQKDGYVTGRMDNNSIVHFPGTEDMIGNIYNVKLDECRGFYYMGEIKEDA